MLSRNVAKASIVWVFAMSVAKVAMSPGCVARFSSLATMRLLLPFAHDCKYYLMIKDCTSNRLLMLVIKKILLIDCARLFAKKIWFVFKCFWLKFDEKCQINLLLFVFKNFRSKDFFCEVFINLILFQKLISMAMNLPVDR